MPRSSTAARLCLVTAGIFLVAQALASTPPAPAAPVVPATTGSQPATEVPAEVFTPPRFGANANHICSYHDPNPACEALASGEEGWVRLTFMVDPAGKPFEIVVTDSTGNRTLERSAISFLKFAKLTPGTLNGKPIESSDSTRYLFKGYGTGGKPRFVSAYKAAQQAISAGDRAAADAAANQMVISNLYEDGFFGLMKYQYALRWGDTEQQLQAIQRAIYSEALPEKVLRPTMITYLELEVDNHHFAEALATWKSLQSLHLEETTKANIQRVVDKLEKLRTDDSAYDVAGQMPQGEWSLLLFKHHFRATVSQGSIAQVKLLCQKGYREFPFDPNLNYEISGATGDCTIRLIGTPGTHFTLTQS